MDQTATLYFSNTTVTAIIKLAQASSRLQIGIRFSDIDLKKHWGQLFLFVAEINGRRMASFMNSGLSAEFGVVYRVKIV